MPQKTERFGDIWWLVDEDVSLPKTSAEQGVEVARRSFCSGELVERVYRLDDGTHWFCNDWVSCPTAYRAWECPF